MSVTVPRTLAPSAEKSDAFWSIPAEQLLPTLKTTAQGLTDAEAQTRLGQGGLRERGSKTSRLLLLLSQFKSPIILVLIFASILSFFLKDAVDGAIILTIILISGVLGFWQERGGCRRRAKAARHCPSEGDMPKKRQAH